MFREYFLIYLLAHIIGDYYLQTSSMAEAKKKSLFKLLQHIVIYYSVCVILTLPIFTVELLWSVSFLSASHAFIDIVKYFISKYNKHNSKI